MNVKLYCFGKIIPIKMLVNNNEITFAELGKKYDRERFPNENYFAIFIL